MAAVMRQRSAGEQWGGVMHGLRDLENSSRRHHETLQQLAQLATDEREREALRLACAQIRTANAAIIAAWRTLAAVAPKPSERPDYKPVSET